MHSIQVKQHDSRDCGPACLASVGSHFGVHYPLARIRQLAGTDQMGTNLLGLIKAADKMGLRAKGVRTNEDTLSTIPLPAIAHIVQKPSHRHHYVVLYKIKKSHMVMMDPSKGRLVKFTKAEFATTWTGVLVLFAMKKNFRPINIKKSNWLRFWQLVKPHRSSYFKALIAAMLFTTLGLGISIYVQKIADQVLVSSNTVLLTKLSLCLILVLGLQMVFGIIKSIYVLKSGQSIDAKLIQGYYHHLLELPQRFFDTMQVGEIISRVNDAIKIRAFINNIGIEIIVNGLIVVSAFVLMFIYSSRLAFMVLLILPVYLFVYKVINRLNRREERKLMEQTAELESWLIESISKIKTVKHYSMEAYAYNQSENKVKALLGTSLRSGMNEIFGRSSTLFIASLFTVLILWIGSLSVLKGSLTTGELFSFYALIGYFSGPINSLVIMNKSYQNALIASDRLFEIMDLEMESAENDTTIKCEVTGDIYFENVSFTYGTRTEVFRDFNLKLNGNEITAIVGENGCGKTTLMSLMQNLYPINNGRIRIGQIDIRNVDRQYLRSVIGVIPQQIHLFSGNIVENIAMGATNPDLTRIKELSEQLGISSFVNQLPCGFETQIGQYGIFLSGGQKQRIGIARALYRDPKILLLDEATAALDSSSQVLIKNLLKALKENGKTIIVVTHRLNSITYADRIVLLDKGQVKEEGSHHQLLKRRGGYFKMWTEESGPIIPT